MTEVDPDPPRSSEAADRWVVRYPLGTVDAARTMGTVAAPLLAGFALAVLAFLATSDKPIRLAGIAMAAFSLGAVLFVFCLQFTFAALLYSAPPGDRMDWLDGDKADPVRVTRARRVQHMDHRLQGRYLARARLTYDLGIISHLIGLAALVAPRRWWSGEDAAFFIVAAALGVELLWIVGGWLGRQPAWLLPGYSAVRDKPPPGSGPPVPRAE